MMSARDAFAYQARACASLGSPFMERLCSLCATSEWPEGPVKDRIFSWEGDLSPRGHSVPLRLAGALHALVLQRDLPIHAVYPPVEVDDAELWSAVSAALVEHQTQILAWLDNAPQTNEVRRSAAIIAAAHVVAAHFGKPLRTSELGASAGLNLMWDRYGLKIGDSLIGPDDVLTLSPEWTGALPPLPTPVVTDRGGVDLSPIDPTNPHDALRIQAYLWPDQPDRLARTRAAIAVAKTKVDQGDAIDWLSNRMAPQPGTTHFIYHTIAWQYFPQERQDTGTRMIEEAGEMATSDSPIAWFAMENDGQDRGAGLTLRLWPGNVRIDLGRADFHGRWIEWKEF